MLFSQSFGIINQVGLIIWGHIAFSMFWVGSSLRTHTQSRITESNRLDIFMALQSHIIKFLVGG